MAEAVFSGRAKYKAERSPSAATNSNLYESSVTYKSMIIVSTFANTLPLTKAATLNSLSVAKTQTQHNTNNFPSWLVSDPITTTITADDRNFLKYRVDLGGLVDTE